MFFLHLNKTKSKNNFYLSNTFSLARNFILFFFLVSLIPALINCQSFPKTSPKKLAQQITKNSQKYYPDSRQLKEKDIFIGDSFQQKHLASSKYFAGITSLTNKKYKQAIQHLEKSLALNPTLVFFSDIYFLLGYSYLQISSTNSLSKAQECFKAFLNYSQKNVSDSFYKNSEKSNNDHQEKIIYAKQFLESSQSANSSLKVIKPYPFKFSPNYQHYFYNHFLIYGYNYDRRLGKSLTLPYYYHDHIGHHAGLMNIFNWTPSLDTILLLQFIGIDYQFFLGVPINIFTTPQENLSLQLMPKGYLAYQNVTEYQQGIFYYNFGIGLSLGWYLQQNIFIGCKSDLYWYHPNHKQQIILTENSTETHASSSFSQWSHSFFDLKIIYFLTRTIGLQTSFYYDYFLPVNNSKKKGLKFTLYYDLLSLGISYDILQNQFSIDFITFYNYQTLTP